MLKCQGCRGLEPCSTERSVMLSTEQRQKRGLPAILAAMLYIFSLWFSSLLPIAHAEPPVLGPDRPDHEVPNRAFDIQRLHLDLALQFEERSIGGTARYTVKRLTDKDFVLDQIDLDIQSVQVDGGDAPWEITGNHLVI